MALDLGDRLKNSAFFFRGYNVTNLGRSAELLAHPAYGPIVHRWLDETGRFSSDVLHRKIDLLGRVRDRQESTLETFGEDIGLIVAMELAQIELLKQFFNIHWQKAKMALGYSLGEVAALIASDVYKLQHLLAPTLSMSPECVEMARTCTMGVIFSRGPELSMDAVRKLCLEINTEGAGVIGISSQMAPNTMLLIGQGSTVDRFKQRMHSLVPEQVHLRKNPHRWPPLHTPLLWQHGLQNRAAEIMHTMPGGFTTPQPTLVSLVTGKASYNDFNSRDILNRWIDHPQRLWDAICETLAAGVETVIHVGPEPNLVPATYQRLSDNVTAQMKGGFTTRMSRRAMTQIARRPWLTKMLSSRAILLRAPFVEHVILEDWLLEQKVP